MKPLVNILQYGSMEKLANTQLAGAYGLHVTTGLIVYEKDGIKKGMIIDTGMVCDWDAHQIELIKYGLSTNDITHILATHFHQDHVQALAKYPSGTHVFHYGSSSILDSSEYGAKIYDKFIEVPEITFHLVDNAHTKKDTIYIIDSENNGKTAFMGDLLFSLFDTLPKETQKEMDSSVSVNPERRYKLVKEFFENNLDITNFYLGHYGRMAERKEIEKYLNEW